MGIEFGGTVLYFDAAERKREQKENEVN